MTYMTRITANGTMGMKKISNCGSHKLQEGFYTLSNGLIPIM